MFKRVYSFLYKYKYIIFLILIYLLFCIQMRNIVLYDDDFEYAYKFLGSSFSDKISFILSKLGFILSNSSFRIITHFVTISGLTLFGINFFRFLNPIFILLLSFIITKIISLFRTIKFDKILFIISFLIITLNISISRETIYWASASIPYVWGCCLLFYFFYYLIKINGDFSKKSFIVLSILILLISLILEQFTFIIIGVFFFLFIESVIKKKKNMKYLYLFFIALFCFIVTYVSVGNINKFNSSPLELPLHENLYYSLFTIFKHVTNINVCGIYLCFLSFLVAFRMFSFGKKYYLPILIILVGNVCFLTNCFGIINIFSLYSLYDSFHFVYVYEGYGNIFIICSLVFFIVYLCSFIYLLFKLFSNNNYLIYIFVSSIISIILPVISLRYVGFRYCFPFLMCLFLLIIYLSDDKKSFVMASLSILLLIDFKTGFILIVLYVLFRKKNINFFLYLLILNFCILFISFISVCEGYKYNKVIHDYNTKELISGKKNIFLLEIPYKMELYCWHTFYSDYLGYNTYYDYLNNKAKLYYSLDNSIFIVLPSELDNLF